MPGSRVEFVASRAWLRDRGFGKACVIVDGSFIDPDYVVVAAGAWTGEVVKQLGQNISLQTGKGYGLISLWNKAGSPIRCT